MERRKQALRSSDGPINTFLTVNMDLRSISHTFPSHRSTSLSHEDLAAVRLPVRKFSDSAVQSLIMDQCEKLRSQSPSEIPKICIIGAGISGLRCADTLIQNGFRVTILEARDRLFGRAHQATLPTGPLIDLGPNWVHGTDHNPILDLAKETGTTLYSWEEHGNVFGEDGRLLEGAGILNDVFWGIILQAFKYSEENTSIIDPETSLYDFVIEKVTEKYPDPLKHDNQHKILLQMAEIWGGFVGSPVTRQSLKFLWLEECVTGENLFCAGTYRKILARIAEPALKAVAIKLSTKVTHIESFGGGVKIITDNGLELQFDEVVMTAPLGYLKNNQQIFSPPLPPRFSQAIEAVGYGCLEKVYITFSRAFWLNKNTEPSKQPFTGFTHWLSPAYASDTNPKRWHQECVDLSTLPEPHGHPTLLFYIFGDQAITLSKDLAALPSEKAKEEHVVKCFKQYFSLLPHYVAGSKDCAPISCYATNWVTDELAGFGSYGTFRTGLQEGDKDIKIMREGLPGRSLWFAGEHVGPFAAMGTATAAYWSGEAVGKRIAVAYGMAANDSAAQETSGSSEYHGTKEINTRGFADKALEK